MAAGTPLLHGGKRTNQKAASTSMLNGGKRAKQQRHRPLPSNLNRNQAWSTAPAPSLVPRRGSRAGTLRDEPPRKPTYRVSPNQFLALHGVGQWPTAARIPIQNRPDTAPSNDPVLASRMADQYNSEFQHECGIDGGTGPATKFSRGGECTRYLNEEVKQHNLYYRHGLEWVI
eukprot:CAMPEP_0119349114 /NCGR_PEP_ID=MMETSP1333-20130426/109388_1 /TAXON_ID=418940 /ORGANISM="Scyphosphaera apsteinii, Strain RCC1455" /LENGTH=172 /DNA_ID=CAMNT_0007361709 /DNA_START=212 /DNA_END=730 /DNA_ORIENTATION=-